jgi:predicted DNA-binding protein (MmcQ/YjbR family)
MTVEVLRTIALKLNGVTEDIKWHDHLCFNIGGKMFLVTSPDSIPPTASFKVSEESFEEVSALPGFEKHKYTGRYNWVQLDDISRLTKKQWEFYIRQSYMLVASRLTTKFRKSIGL